MTITLPGFGFLIVSRIVLAIGGGVFVIGAKTVAAKLAAPGRQAANQSACAGKPEYV
ncbi:hypothetical protein [Paenibacillus sp. Root444D2]|uniref:hypothetical protein n=1 Tax=Paenibacillus sp. Root444D2 TaxID=1736538 RepID=UPI001910017C|nr:hypothetical protein [Paenibacillus sp. Root444D2]